MPYEPAKKLIIDRSVRHLCYRPYPNHSKGCPNYNKKEGCPPKSPMIDEILNLSKPFWLNEDTQQVFQVFLKGVEDFYIHLLDNKHWKPQQARAVLTNCLKTEIVVTANLLEWAHIYHMRTAQDAHPQMRELMDPLFNDIERNGYFHFFPDVMDYYYKVNKLGGYQ